MNTTMGRAQPAREAPRKYRPKAAGIALGQGGRDVSIPKRPNIYIDPAYQSSGGEQLFLSHLYRYERAVAKAAVEFVRRQSCECVTHTWLFKTRPHEVELCKRCKTLREIEASGWRDE